MRPFSAPTGRRVFSSCVIILYLPKKLNVGSLKNCAQPALAASTERTGRRSVNALPSPGRERAVRLPPI